MRESVVEKRFREQVEKLGGKAPKWISPGNNGVPDRLAILPKGRTIYVELKAPGKKLGVLQEKWAKTLRGLGHTVFKIDCKQDVDDFIKWIESGGESHLL